MTEYQSVDNFYQGSQSSLDPSYGNVFTGYRMGFSRLGSATSIQTANQVEEVSSRLKEGTKIVELSPITPEVLEAIPRQQFEEIKQLSKLTGVETSLHAPIVDPAGFTREGWSETSRKMTEQEFVDVLNRAHELNPDGNVPVTIHASQLPGKEVFIEKGKEKETMIIAFDKETGRMEPIKIEKRHFPGEEATIMTPEEHLDFINKTQWNDNIRNIRLYGQRADDFINGSVEAEREGIPNARKKIEQELGQAKALAERQIADEKRRNQIIGEMERNAKMQMKNEEERIKSAISKNNERAEANIIDTERSVQFLFNRASKYLEDGKSKEKLGDISRNWREKEMEIKRLEEEGKQTRALEIKSELLSSSLRDLQKLNPNVYVKLEDFAMDQAAKTLGNAAFQAYKKYGDNAPFVSIENPPVGQAFARAEELKEMVKKSRENFTSRLIEDGYSKKEAEKQAEKMIGATWDTAHINMLRKFGASKEKIIEESEKIAPYVKHMHIVDNFGYQDSHLPPGMGNVPIKEIMMKMEKEGFSGKAIIEAGGFVQHFKTSPTPYVLEAFGSPVYGAGGGAFWNQARETVGNYFSGYGMFPEQHFSMYGSGFSGLPAEVGGQIPGKQSRFSGTPNA